MSANGSAVEFPLAGRQMHFSLPDRRLDAVAAPDVLAAGGHPEREAVAQIRGARGPLLTRLQHWDQQHYLVDDIMVKVDRATMAHSLEARCPLLDHHVIELAGAQASTRHGDAQTTKRLFRKVIAPWVPADVLTRPKRGFGVPLRRWFKEGMIGWAREILFESHIAICHNAQQHIVGIDHWDTTNAVTTTKPIDRAQSVIW